MDYDKQRLHTGCAGPLKLFCPEDKEAARGEVE